MEKREELKKRIMDEMLTDHYNALDRNFDTAKRFIGVTAEGKVDVKVKDDLNGKYQILLYLLGKLYAKEAGLTDTESVGSKELMDELGIREGSLRPWIKELRDKNKIKQVKKDRYMHYIIPTNLIETTLKEVEEKMKKKY
ncbi:hypothetical protein [Methanobacterium formicicum]|uniref:hypothetical protein n=1 Tax=Methanobacterium formicicum TaxID=2162 RepID=UPI0024123D3A|nr:hypothetical protein [Methanobacterium formicicum]MDG3546622.1 hypothetical protein [Methanobacterium formicicum]